MARPQKPLDRDGSLAAEFAFWLRDLRSHAGLTNSQVGVRSGYATSTVQAAMNGQKLPGRHLTLAIVEACGGDAAQWAEYWLLMRRALDPEAPVGAVPDLTPPWQRDAARTVGSVTAESVPALADRTEEVDAGPAGAGPTTAGAAADASPGQASAPAWVNRRIAWGTGATLVVILAAALLPFLLDGGGPTGRAATTGPPSTAASRPGGPTFAEEESDRNGASTFRYLNGSAPGQPLAYRQVVQVSCKVYDPSFESTEPGGYWYRIADKPWNGGYYAVANTFANGDPPQGPRAHFRDARVPDCPGTPASKVSTGKILGSPCSDLRNSPSGSAAVLKCVAKNTVVSIQCTVIGSPQKGPYGTESTWDRVTYSGVTGYIGDAWIFTGTNNASAGPCSNSGRILGSPCSDLRNSPNGSAAVLKCVPKNTVLSIQCTVKGTAQKGPYGTESTWDRVTFSGATGYIGDAWIYTGTNNASAGPC
jgi:hypothetical protein